MDRIALEKHLKQNKEIIRINQVQSNRIASLEAEITKLISENIQLRTQVIQLTHCQDLTNQKTQIERKLRELHRMVKSLGTTSASTTQSPIQPIIKKSPKKANLLQISPEHSPERARIDFVSARSRPRSLAAPSRILRAPEVEEPPPAGGDDSPRSIENCTTFNEAQQSPISLPENVERRRDSRERDREREARRSSRRISRTSEEMLAVPIDHMTDHLANGSPKREHRKVTSKSSQDEDRVARRRSRSSMNFEPSQLFVNESEQEQGSARRSSRSLNTNDDKENAPSERRSTSNIRILHSSPVKSRTALNLIADPLPSQNMQNTLPTPTKPLKEVQEVKSEPVSPSLESGARQDTHSLPGGTEESTNRSRRGKTVNYAEPSLRHKMRRTESLPGDKRRKSSYRRSSSSLLEDRRSSSSSTAAHQAITIEED